LNSENLKSIEFHLSTKHYENLLRSYGYTKFITKNGEEFIVTNLILNHLMIENMFKNVKTIKR